MQQHPKPPLLVLAAGMGSRYGGLKQIDPMGPAGETILDYSVFDAIRAGFGKVVFIIRPDFADAFKQQIVPKFAGKIAVDFAYQTLDKLPAGFSVPAGREKPWGTTHAILCAKGVVKENFAVINADDFYGRDSYAQLAKFLTATAPTSSEFSMVGFTLKNTLSEHGSVARGAENREEGKPVQPLTGNEPASMNMWGFTPKLFDHLDRVFHEFLVKSGTEMKSECFIPLTVGQLVTEKHASVKVLRTDSAWFGVTYKEDKPIVQESLSKLIKAGEYPNNLWA